MKENKIIVPELNEETIKSKIYEIRGQKVMLDFELAEIYGYTTKAFNQQVQRNIDIFPERYMFKLTNKEWECILMSQIVTANNKIAKKRYIPTAFTEQGIYMLMMVLKGELATKQSIVLIDTFKRMNDYINSNSLIDVNEVIKLTNIVNEHSLEISDIESKLSLVMENFIDPSK